MYVKKLAIRKVKNVNCCSIFLVQKNYLRSWPESRYDDKLCCSQVGNAVPPPMGKAIGREIMKVVVEKEEKKKRQEMDLQDEKKSGPSE